MLNNEKPLFWEIAACVKVVILIYFIYFYLLLIISNISKTSILSKLYVFGLNLIRYIYYFTYIRNIYK